MQASVTADQAAPARKTVQHFSEIQRDTSIPQVIKPRDPATVNTPPPRVPTHILNDDSPTKKDLTW